MAEIGLVRNGIFFKGYDRKVYLFAYIIKNMSRTLYDHYLIALLGCIQQLSKFERGLFNLFIHTADVHVKFSSFHAREIQSISPLNFRWT